MDWRNDRLSMSFVYLLIPMPVLITQENYIFYFVEYFQINVKDLNSIFVNGHNKSR